MTSRTATAAPAASPVTPPATAVRRGGRIIRVVQKFGIYGVLVVIVIAATVVYPGFLSWGNIELLLTQNAPLGIVAVGMTLVIITGGFDLSVGAVYAAGGVIAAYFATQGAVVLGAVLGVVAGAVAGLLNGVVVTRFHVNPFIATLGSSTIFAGIVLVTTGAQPIAVDAPSFAVLGQSTVFGVPLPLLFVVVAFAAGWLVLNRSVYGRRLLSVGGNREASRLSGIRTAGVMTGAYIVSGVLAAFAGVVSASQLGIGQGASSSNLALEAISVVVIGGTSLLGGEGSIVRTAVGLLIIATLDNLFFSLALDSNWQSITQGVIIIAAVGLDQLARRRGR